MVLSSTALKCPCPILLAGTCRQYSKKAIPQLINITSRKAEVLNFKCPYQAKVMNMLESKSKPIVVNGTGIRTNILIDLIAFNNLNPLVFNN